MTILLIILTILIGIVLDWLLALLVPISLLFFPLGPFLTLFWVQKLNFSTRLALTFIVGWILDAITLVPFGTNLIVLFVLALAVQPLRAFSRYRTIWLYEIGFTVGLYIAYLSLTPLFERALLFFFGGR